MSGYQKHRTQTTSGLIVRTTQNGSSGIQLNSTSQLSGQKLLNERASSHAVDKFTSGKVEDIPMSFSQMINEDLSEGCSTQIHNLVGLTNRSKENETQLYVNADINSLISPAKNDMDQLVKQIIFKR